MTHREKKKEYFLYERFSLKVNSIPVPWDLYQSNRQWIYTVDKFGLSYIYAWQWGKWHQLRLGQTVWLTNVLFFHIHLNLWGKEIDIRCDKCIFFSPWYLTVHFALEGLEHLSKVLALSFWGTYPCGMSVSFHSAQASLCNFHIMAVVDRLLGLTVNMFEKLSSWWKKN